MFTHLHVHSDASKLDGLSPVDRLVDNAAKLGFDSLGLTDHGTLSNSIAFTLACQRHNIKPILGMEAYVSEAGERYHLTLLADGNKGFNTLVQLNNIAQAGEDTTRPTFPISELFSNNEGIYVLTGCPASFFQKAAYPDALDLLTRLKAVLQDRLFAEVQFIGNQPWERAIQLSKDLHIPAVVTNDVHFPLAGDAVAHKLLTQLKAAFTYDSGNLFLATENEMRDRVGIMVPDKLPILEKGMHNSGILASKLSGVNFKNDPRLPDIQDADTKLSNMCWSRLENRHSMTVIPSEYSSRLGKELDIIISLHFEGYFLILQDILNYARSINVRVGPGRGSGAGSLVCYLLGITEIDPIKYDLSFARFLNSKRVEMPDIDSDLSSAGRDVVLAYAKDKWGALPVATYSRYSHKSLVHDLARVCHIDKTTDENAADEGPNSLAFADFIDKAPEAFTAYKAMLGQIRHMGQHAGGVVIVNKDVELPLERTAHGDLVVGWTEGENRELSYAGIVKLDLLALTALDVLDRLEKKYPTIKPEEPIDNHPVFEMFQRGDTTGIFQFSGSQGIIKFTKEVHPTKFIDLVTINALYRPGPLDAGTASHFPEWRKSPRLVDPFIDDILEPTAGIIAFQEQFMSIYARVMGVSFEDADIARKVLTKSNPGNPEWEEKFNKLKGGFLNGWEHKRLDPLKGEKLWEEISKHTRYSFNKAHSVCYSYLAWLMAWWKWRFPLDFYAALLSVDRNAWEQSLFEIAEQGYEIKAPDVNYSTGDFVAKGNALYLPLNIVKNLGEKGIQNIIDNQPYDSIEDFIKRIDKKCVAKRARTGLYYNGGFDNMAYNSGSYVGNDYLFKLLKIEQDDTVETMKQIQLKFMGFAIPDKKLLNKIAQAKSAGWLAGVIKSITDKESNFGKYQTVILYPEGMCWNRGVEFPYQEGDEIMMKVSDKNNKLLSVRPL